MSKKGFLYGLLTFALVALPASAQKGWLGIYPDLAKKGAVVEEVFKGSPAAKAGLKKGDTLVSVNGRKLPSIQALSSFLKGTKVGQELSFQVLRGDQTIKVDLQLGIDPTMPEKPKIVTSPKIIRMVPAQQKVARLVPGKVMGKGGVFATRLKQIQLTSEAQLSGIMKMSARFKRPVILMFTASWASACQVLQKNMMDSRISRILSRAFVVNVDVEKFPKLANKYGVDPVPHLQIISANGKSLAKKVGVVDKKRLTEFLLKSLGTPSRKTSPFPQIIRSAKAKKAKSKDPKKDINGAILRELRAIRKVLQDIQRRLPG